MATTITIQSAYAQIFTTQLAAATSLPSARAYAAKSAVEELFTIASHPLKALEYIQRANSCRRSYSNDSGIQITTAANHTATTTCASAARTDTIAMLKDIQQALQTTSIACSKKLESYRSRHDRSWNHMTALERETLSSLHQSYLDARVLYTVLTEKMGAFMVEMEDFEEVGAQKGDVYAVARDVKQGYKCTVLAMRKRGMLEFCFGPINGLLMEGLDAGEEDTEVVTEGCLMIEKDEEEIETIEGIEVEV